MQKQNQQKNRQRRNRCFTKTKMTMRKATMILLANTFAGTINPDGTVNEPWPDKAESLAAANMVAKTVAQRVVEADYKRWKVEHGIA